MLPCGSTLNKYLGPMSMDVGMTPVIRWERLAFQLKELSHIEKYCSMIFDEMAIKPISTFVKQKGQMYGSVNFGRYRRKLKLKCFKSTELANRLLWFVLKGLSTNYRIPVSYFFVRKLKSEDLVKLITCTLEELEDIGYRVIRLVGDDYSVNQKAFKILSGKEAVCPQIQNPANTNFPLFLSYGYCHILKNLINLRYTFVQI